MSETTNCSYCGKPNPVGAITCKECGNNLTAPEKSKPKKSPKPSPLPGFAIVGCLLTGLLGMIGAVMSMEDGQGVAAAACLFSGAFAFGIVVFISFQR